MHSDFHLEENAYSDNPEHHWLVETAMNVAVCAHATEQEARECLEEYQHRVL